MWLDFDPSVLYKISCIKSRRFETITYNKQGSIEDASFSFLYDFMTLRSFGNFYRALGKLCACLAAMMSYISAHEVNYMLKKLEIDAFRGAEWETLI